MEWWKEQRKRIAGAGWEGSAHDECSYYRWESDGKITMQRTSVDDRLQTRDNRGEIRRIGEYIMGKCKWPDLGSSNNIVGKQVSEGGIS